MGSFFIISLVCGLAVLAFFVGIYILVERPGDMAGRLEAYATLEPAADGRAGGRRKGLTYLFDRLDRLLSGQSVAQRLALRLAQANMQLTVPEAVVIAFSAAVIGGCFGFVLQGRLISAIAGMVLTVVLLWAFLEFRSQQRVRLFHDQLVDVLTLTVGSLRGGHGLLTALDLVSKELSPPAAEEFSRVLREVGFGLSQSEALNNLVKRMETEDLQLVVTAVNISHEVGGNLSLVLEKIAETIRERIRLQGEIRVLTTQQRLTTYLLVALPFILSVLLALLNPGWMLRLFRPGWIRIIPVSALIMEILGFFIAQRLMRIEV